MCPSTSWTANQWDFSFQRHLGWCRVRGGWCCLMGWQTGLGCLSLSLDGRCLVVIFLIPDLLKWVAARGLSWYRWSLWVSRWWWKSKPGFSLKCCSLSPCEWDFHLPSQLLPTEDFWGCMAMRLAWQSSHTALHPSMGVSPSQPRLQQKLKLSPKFSFLAALLFSFISPPCPFLSFLYLK